MSEELKEIQWALEEALLYPGDQEPINKAFSALSRLEAREAEAPKDARELAEKVRYGVLMRGMPRSTGGDAPIEGFRYERTVNQSALEIERYVQQRIAATPKTVPMAMLEELVEYGLNSDGVAEITRNLKKYEIATRYGYEVTK
jgi:hypothetical protein